LVVAFRGRRVECVQMTVLPKVEYRGLIGLFGEPVGRPQCPRSVR
jgi:hypothetical protein